MIWQFTQRVVALAGVVVLAPLIGSLAILVRATSPGPAFHRTIRARPGGTFTLFKLRSMHHPGRAGSAVTAADDPRITRLGRALRRMRLDELPQLWNVVRGDMLLVGPRPEDPRFVDSADPTHRVVFAAVPGITSPTALAFRDEEAMLAREAHLLARDHGRDAPNADDVDQAYKDRILPLKIEMDAAYLRTRSVRRDLVVVARTLMTIVTRGQDTTRTGHDRSPTPPASPLGDASGGDAAGQTHDE